MSENTFMIRISEFKVEKAPAVLKVFGLGSCVALALHDPKKKLGGLAHILLPGPTPKELIEKKAMAFNVTKYADRAIKDLVKDIQDQGGSVENLKAVVAGGANMFPPRQNPFDTSEIQKVGERNVEAVKKHLARLDIPVVGEDTGGNTGRTVTFDTATGKVTITNMRGQRKEL